MKQQEGLFAESPRILEFDEAFDAWAATVKSRCEVKLDSSIAAYKQLWAIFSKWNFRQPNPIGLPELGVSDLALFLESLNPRDAADASVSPRYVWRMLTLIDRVLVNDADGHGHAPNRAANILLQSREDWHYANASKRDTLPEYLDGQQARILYNFLAQPMPRSGRQRVDLTWQELRNRTATSMQLGAGVTPGEVRALKMSNLTVNGGARAGVPWKVTIPGDGTTGAREVPLAGWLGRLLKRWLEVRQELGVAGDWLFPSTRSGKPWSKVSHYAAVYEVLDQSGIDKQLTQGGSFRLRHTFALRQLRRVSAQQVADWLGVVDPAVMVRYSKVVYAPVNDMA